MKLQLLQMSRFDFIDNTRIHNIIPDSAQNVMMKTQASRDRVRYSTIMNKHSKISQVSWRNKAQIIYVSESVYFVLAE